MLWGLPWETRREHCPAFFSAEKGESSVILLKRYRWAGSFYEGSNKLCLGFLQREGQWGCLGICLNPRGFWHRVFSKAQILQPSLLKPQPDILPLHSTYLLYIKALLAVSIILFLKWEMSIIKQLQKKIPQFPLIKLILKQIKNTHHSLILPES